MPRIAGLFGERAEVAESFNSACQTTGMAHALDMFNSRVRDPTIYKLILVARFDMVWKLPIGDWPTADFNAFNFLGRCEVRRPDPKLCVQDSVQAMPGAYWLRFSKQVFGISPCFIVGCPGCLGHFCYNRAAAAFGEDNIAFITDEIPNHTVREPIGVVENGYLP
mmetsp:Transcript_36370/g.113315  ORF Transcript_36370/g.113315 Transcript_36370/m.113315 type:complete len:165 (-) Transcript_36370:62-556(-)